MRQFFVRLAIGGGVLAASVGQASPLERLVANSPFAPAAVGATVPAGSALEFRGVFADGGEYFFSIFDPATRSSLWVALHETGLPFALRSYDAAQQTVVAEHQGRTLKLTLKKAPVVAMGPPPGQTPVAGVPPAEALAPTGPPEEAARLAAIANEIRRRRELRQQATSMEPPKRQP